MGGTPSSAFPLENPTELSMFEYKTKPFVLAINKFLYCVFPKVILVFDSKGTFSTSLSLKSLKITLRRQTADVKAVNGIFSSNEYVSFDSKLVSLGDLNTTWTHITKSGEPDIGFENNPPIEQRVNTYEYGVAEIKVGGGSLKLAISSYLAIEELEKIRLKLK